jgi:hypothetical protein
VQRSTSIFTAIFAPQRSFRVVHRRKRYSTRRYCLTLGRYCDRALDDRIGLFRLFSARRLTVIAESDSPRIQKAPVLLSSDDSLLPWADRIALHGTVGWEPGTRPISIEKIDLFARNHFAFVAGFVFEVIPSFVAIAVEEDDLTREAEPFAARCPP